MCFRVLRQCEIASDHTRCSCVSAVLRLLRFKSRGRGGLWVKVEVKVEVEVDWELL